MILPHTQRSWIAKAHIVGQTIKPTYYRPTPSPSDSDHGHTDHGTVSHRPLPKRAKEEEWVLVDSTPASCIQIGLYHYFRERGPVDLVISGPNYGRNTTAVFALSSGTIGGAMEAAVCGVRAIALSYAFFDRNHDPDIIAAASRTSVRIVENLHKRWDPSVQLYSINVPLVPHVESTKVLYTHMLQNSWMSGSCFTEVEVPEENDYGPEEREMEIRRAESMGGDTDRGIEAARGAVNGHTGNGADVQGHGEGNSGSNGHLRYTHKHFKWSPKFKDVYDSVEKAAPGNDGWAVKEGFIRYVSSVIVSA